MSESPVKPTAPIPVSPTVIADENFGEMLIRVDQLAEDKVILDFNHPLAGKELTFDVKVLDIS